MDLKRTGIWILAIVGISVLFVGRLTGFTYKNLEVQLHDTYYVFDPLTITVLMIVTLGLVSMGVTSVKILKNHHPFLRVILVLIIAAILFIPVLMCYTFVMMFFAGKY